MWLTAYGRDFYGQAIANCVSNTHAATFDGVNDYAIAAPTGALVQTNSSLMKQWVSLWIKDLDTSAKNGGETMWAQGFSGNDQNNAWYIQYATRYSNGSNGNSITFQWRSNGNSNRVVKRWDLFGANSSITGSTSITDFWLANNSNINTNDNGYVHILLLMDVPGTGQAMSTGNYNLYWNGQLMTLKSTPNIENGVASGQANPTSAQAQLGYNVSFGTNYSNCNIDELFVTNSSNSGIIMTEFGLSTDQDIADFLYNSGCPVDLGTDSRWTGGWYKFDNTWATELGGGAFNPINGAGFTTDYA